MRLPPQPSHDFPACTQNHIPLQSSRALPCSPLTSILSCSGTLPSQKHKTMSPICTLMTPVVKVQKLNLAVGGSPAWRLCPSKRQQQKSPASALPLHTHSPTHAGTQSHSRSKLPWGFPRPPPGCCLSIADQNTQSPAPRENQSRVRQALERGRAHRGGGEEEKQER